MASEMQTPSEADITISSVISQEEVSEEPIQQAEATLSVNLGPFLRDGLIKVHMDNEITAVFWLRSYLVNQNSAPDIAATNLNFNQFTLDLCGHFGYSEQQHSLVWDPRGLIHSLDCEYVVRGRNGWVAALILMQNQKFVQENKVPCHFHIVNYIEFEMHKKTMASKDTNAKQIA
ncbi:hypothetical protein N7457_000578 [Penicillium paradoxum]|uniref:uncharacterized protein n=1 Tax=Penicillium paradoxum TaxID=176176 RepID=UPI0025466CF3|nr:uncharacterized protein N7457_000578 [Penicillium paradoxum]KAJ5793979.1 hypothetical protein N7457_000578 [Penicillium paradoxum]